MFVIDLINGNDILVKGHKDTPDVEPEEIPEIEVGYQTQLELVIIKPSDALDNVVSLREI